MSEKRPRQGRGGGDEEADPLAFLDAVPSSGGARESSGDEGGRPSGRRRRSPKKTGRRSDPDYVQISAWVRHDLRAEVSVAQAEEYRSTGERRDFSELVESLLAFYAREGDPWEIAGRQRQA